MKLQRKKQKAAYLIGAVLSFLALGAPAKVLAAGSGSLLTITEEAQIRPISDGSGKYLMKSDGFYCLDENGSKDTSPSVHYFDHLEIDGTELNGYYYHDESGKFQAGSSQVAVLKSLTCEEKTFDGLYMINNLGRLSAAPQVRYMDGLNLNGVVYDGFFYFDEYGQMCTGADIHSVHMVSNGRSFDGEYYFGGANGALLLDGGVTSEGFTVDADGKVEEIQDLNDALEKILTAKAESYDGIWSIYVKNLDTGDTISINNQPLHSASLIKAFIMEKTYADMDKVLKNEAAKLGNPDGYEAAQAKVDSLLWNMITVSDNESCNELVRLQATDQDFCKGARLTNRYLWKEGYLDTTIQNNLRPSSTPEVGLGGSNTTSVEDCGRLLEKIYNGTCVSEEASEAMLNLLLNQQNVYKIPAGITGDVKIANKTGETDISQHDMAIVYGETCTYILCVMSENCPSETTAIQNISEISGIVYNYLNQ